MMLPEGEAITYADCAIVPEPTPEQLAEIAISSAHMHEVLTGQVPAVAMLSFSTNGSAKHHSVERVQLATKIARDSSGSLQIDGELQFDAAFESRIGSVKAPNSIVAGRANVFIFPSLDAGNIAYKITERLGGARAIGPLLLGTARPLNDLSRGCDEIDIHLVALASAVQSLALEPVAAGHF
jgi:phosphotransacetylase